MILPYALAFASICFALGLLINLYQILRAADVVDKILALDTMVINVIALLVLYGIQTRSGVNFEVAMLFALTGFVGTVAYCKYLLRSSIIE